MSSKNKEKKDYIIEVKKNLIVMCGPVAVGVAGGCMASSDGVYRLGQQYTLLNYLLRRIIGFSFAFAFCNEMRSIV